jgi:DNA-binding SARP family transcriptional activator
MTSLKVRLLGPFRVWRNDQLVAPEEWPTRKTRSLLKILLTERGHVVPKERLMELLWPDLLPRSAANSLRVGICRLRRVLEPELTQACDATFILTHPQGYIFQVTAHCWIDADAFQEAVAKGQRWERRGEWAAAIAAYRAAAELYRGDYLEEDLYVDWAAGPRDQLREVYLDLLGRLAECHAQRGQYRRALAVCQRILALERVRESVYRQVMVYHCRLGQRDQAIRAFERCQLLLAEELGVDPASQTVALHKLVLREDIPGETKVSPPMAARDKPDRQTLAARLPFVGRSDDVSTLERHLAAAMSGRGRLVLIEGEVGVGKTRLAEEFLTLAVERGAGVLRGRAHELERDLPYQPVREALRRHVVQRMDIDSAKQVLGPWAPLVAMLIPELEQILPDSLALYPLPSEEDRHRLLIGLTQFCLSLAGPHSLVFFLEDLHWADSSTLQFLSFLVRHIAWERMMVLGTYRGEEVRPDHPLTTVERRLVRRGLAFRLELHRLSPTAVADMVRRKAARSWESAVFCRRLYEETEGNPLFLAELLRSLVKAGSLIEDPEDRWCAAPAADLANQGLGLPATVRAVIEARCHAAGEVEQRVLCVAAVIGRPFAFDLLQRASNLDADTLLDALDDLLTRRLIRERPETQRGSYDFTHGKIRQVIYENLSPARRIHLHRQVAAALESQYRERPEEVARRLAHHYKEAGESGTKVGYSLQAGDRGDGDA